jgi:hypothetical protein
MVAVAAFVFAWWYLVRRCVSRAAVYHGARFDGRPAWQRHFIPSGSWGPRGVALRFGALLSYQAPRRLFDQLWLPAYEAVFAVVAAVPLDCGAVFVCLGLWSVGCAAFVALRRPYLAAFMTTTACASALNMGLMMLLTAAAVFAGGASTSALESAVLVLSMLQSVLVALSAVYSAVLMLVVTLYGESRMGQDHFVLSEENIPRHRAPHVMSLADCIPDGSLPSLLGTVERTSGIDLLERKREDLLSQLAAELVWIECAEERRLDSGRVAANLRLAMRLAVLNVTLERLRVKRADQRLGEVVRM